MPASSESQYAAAGSARGREPGPPLREVGLTLETPRSWFLLHYSGRRTKGGGLCILGCRASWRTGKLGKVPAVFYIHRSRISQRSVWLRQTRGGSSSSMGPTHRPAFSSSPLDALPPLVCLAGWMLTLVTRESVSLPFVQADADICWPGSPGTAGQRQSAADALSPMVLLHTLKRKA